MRPRILDNGTAVPWSTYYRAITAASITVVHIWGGAAAAVYQTYTKYWHFCVSGELGAVSNKHVNMQRRSKAITSKLVWSRQRDT